MFEVSVNFVGPLCMEIDRDDDHVGGIGNALNFLAIPAAVRFGPFSASYYDSALVMGYRVREPSTHRRHQGSRYGSYSIP